MRHILAAMAFAVLGAGCATPLTPQELSALDAISALRDPIATSPGAFHVEDRREPDMVRTRIYPIGWAGGFSCHTGLWQLGDDHFAPDRLARLEAALAAAFPARHGEGAIIVQRYDIILNGSAEAEAVAMGAAFGSVGVFGVGGTPGENAPQIWRAPKCGGDRMQVGWFDPADLATNHKPVVVGISANVFGRDYTVNAAYAPAVSPDRLGVSHYERSPAFHVFVQRAMALAEQRLVQAVAANEPAPAPAAADEEAPLPPHAND